MSDEELDASIDLTPLLDVVFVVLILFMVVVPMLQLDGVALAPGRGPEVRSAGQRSIISLHVQADDRIFLGKRQIAPAMLEEALAAAHAAHPGVTPQLFQDKEARFGTYQLVKNACERAGFEEMEVMLEPS